MRTRGVHDDLVTYLFRQLDYLGYGVAPEEHMRGHGRADLLVSRDRFRRFEAHADAAIEVKSAISGPGGAEKACRQVLRYAVGWRRDSGRIAVPIIVPATRQVRPDAVEVCRRRGVNLVLDADGQRLRTLVALIGSPHIPEEPDHEGWLRHGLKLDIQGISPQELADRHAGVAA